MQRHQISSKAHQGPFFNAQKKQDARVAGPEVGEKHYKNSLILKDIKHSQSV